MSSIRRLSTYDSQTESILSTLLIYTIVLPLSVNARLQHTNQSNYLWQFY